MSEQLLLEKIKSLSSIINNHKQQQQQQQQRQPQQNKQPLQSIYKQQPSQQQQQQRQPQNNFQKIQPIVNKPNVNKPSPLPSPPYKGVKSTSATQKQPIVNKPIKQQQQTTIPKKFSNSSYVRPSANVSGDSTSQAPLVLQQPTPSITTTTTSNKTSSPIIANKQQQQLLLRQKKMMLYKQQKQQMMLHYRKSLMYGFARPPYYSYSSPYSYSFGRGTATSSPPPWLSRQPTITPKYQYPVSSITAIKTTMQPAAKTLQLKKATQLLKKKNGSVIDAIYIKQGNTLIRKKLDSTYITVNNKLIRQTDSNNNNNNNNKPTTSTTTTTTSTTTTIKKKPLPLASKKIFKAPTKPIGDRMKAALKKMEKKTQYCLFFNRFGENNLEFLFLYSSTLEYLLVECKCNNNDSCKYIHDKDRVRVCPKYLSGKCEDENCTLQHKTVDIDQMPVCYQFLRGMCTHENCPYLHVYVSRDAEVCPDFLKGYCPNGSECLLRHTYSYKKKSKDDNQHNKQ
ncbi:hypothetical protein PPL_03164 [Heterostelium album PN500]|uniref:C3H1-type domain-containing protein n=1 Tax=Heterostelium pallidum (strain ATCC 26659 / Pp 5 / PN500) TaxID=670386 RepID=D3B443_HETP5|nr:hypothetical protein PPL_03164 [Heterostelium album PN500]EFA84091.1 hypothetical protein PPL_03164 [Heterostelium album PN500]|eukprot:XP_020436208.1 hypothetical protein PPL_03164 [Heterostelium album PN500]